ncbi:hypothetical protein HPG69_012118 [Diceros bicornis minor]|uniref:Uncharacterized protein n=1 Tax=Diceros bicornis minor TaxID=77932 RepID=A0A7J7EHW2_DICBM|nr:hypothetical protein HPG69_012118 [Diceros bicornis minor]
MAQPPTRPHMETPQEMPVCTRLNSISKCPQDCRHIDVNQPCPFCWNSSLEIPFKEKAFPRPPRRALGLCGAVRSERSRPRASSRAHPPPTLLLGREKRVGRTAPSPPGPAGPFSSVLRSLRPQETE